VEFSLQCAYAYGTSALRSHVNTSPSTPAFVWPVMAAARSRWAGKVDLQLVAMCVPLSAFAPGCADGDALASLAATHGGLLGVSLSQPTRPAAESHSLAAESLKLQSGGHGGLRKADFEACVEGFFEAAVKHGLAIDVHADENGDDEADAVRLVACKALEHGLKGKVTVGHATALALAAPDLRATTLAALRAADVGLVSLPMVNMYLQDRVPGRTPLWRGVTLLHEIKAAGVRVALASDNTRDAFYAYGDLDMLEVLREGVRIGHLDHPIGDWPTAVTSVPASILGAAGHGCIIRGLAANLVLFRARSFSELLSRSQHDRIVIRDGAVITATVPDFAVLDDLMMGKA